MIHILVVLIFFREIDGKNKLPDLDQSYGKV